MDMATYEMKVTIIREVDSKPVVWDFKESEDNCLSALHKLGEKMAQIIGSFPDDSEIKYEVSIKYVDD